MSATLPLVRRDAPAASDGASKSKPRLRRAGLRSRLKRFGRKIGLGRALGVAVLLVLIAIRIWDPLPVEAIRLKTFDVFQMLKPRAALPSRPVAIVDIDEASLAELGQWPWPRTRVAEMITRLTAAGAVIIAFDVVFAEPDRMSPAGLADALTTLDEATRERLRALPSNDQVMADAIRASRVVLGQTAAEIPVGWRGTEDPPRTMVGTRGPDPADVIPTFPGLLRNVPVLEDAAAGRGLFSILPERDGLVRRVPLLVRAEDTTLPTLTLEILRILTASPGIVAKTDAAGFTSVSLRGLELPTDPHGQVWVHFSRHDPARFVSARDVLAGTVPAGRFTNKIVLVGTSAIGLRDIKTTPIDRAIPGVEVHAELIENALTRSTLVAPNYATVVELLVAIAVATAIILFAPILGAVNLLALGGGVATFLAYASWYRFSNSGVLLDATFPLLASFSVYLTIVFTNYSREQLGRARIRSAFGQYLSPALVEQLAHSPEKLKLGGEERRMTIMFSDVRGFTTISEFYKHDPAGLTHLMNRFLTPLTNAILDRKGTIDKYMGDAIMAFWNAPLDDPHQEINAAAAALDMLDRMAALNLARKQEAESGGFPVLPLDVGIGINTGACVVGNMGSDLRFDYSVLGDTVNLASRLEGQSKTYGIKTILGSATAAAISNDFAVLAVDLIRVKGKEQPEEIFTLVGDGRVLRTESFAALALHHQAMIDAYRGRDWSGSRARLAEARALAEGLAIDGLYELYVRRIAAFEAEPPPPDWTGVYVAESK